MEIILQWFDDLDDLLFAGALTSEHARRVCLRLGLTASLVDAFVASIPWVTLTCVCLALVGVGSWMVCTAAEFASRRSERHAAAA